MRPEPITGICPWYLDANMMITYMKQKYIGVYLDIFYLFMLRAGIIIEMICVFCVFLCVLKLGVYMFVMLLCQWYKHWTVGFNCLNSKLSF